MKFEKFLLLLIVVIFVVNWIYYYPILPRRVVVQFDFSGNPTSSSAKFTFLLTSITLFMALALVFGLSPKLIEHIPAKWWNIPRADYWLSPEKKEETFKYMERQLDVLGIATLLFVLFMFNLVLRFNISGEMPMQQQSFFIILLLFIVFVILWTMMLVSKFKNIKVNNQP